MDKKNTQNKKVFIKTTSGRNYTGVVIKEDENFLYIVDKFNLEVRISLKDIEVVEEVRE